MSGQTLSASETEDLLTSMMERVERLLLGVCVTLDVETVDNRISELTQGTCKEIQCNAMVAIAINTENISPGGQILSAGGHGRRASSAFVFTND